MTDGRLQIKWDEWPSEEFYEHRGVFVSGSIDLSHNPRSSDREFLDLKRVIVSNLVLTQTLGLEMGAFDRPFFTPQEANVRFLDYRTTEQLRSLASTADGHSPDWVVDVDFVVSGSGNWDMVPNETFDWVLSSHALEHTPDLVGILNTISAKIKPGGLVISVLPDKRRTFDAYRPITSLGRVIEDSIMRATANRPQACFDSVFYGRALNINDAQNAYNSKLETLVDNNNFDAAMQAAKKALVEYQDAHNYVFTSESFYSIVKHVCESRLADLAPYKHYHTADGQVSFVSILKKI